jgi:hypothetical protein
VSSDSESRTDRGRRWRRVGSQVASATALVAGLGLVAVAFSPSASAVTTWSAPALIDRSSPAVDLDALSCPTTNFCMAIESSGYTYTYNGTTWSPGPTLNQTVFSLSCASATFCAAGDGNGNENIFNGGTWTTTNVDGGFVMDSVSCPTTSFCVAVDGDGGGDAVTWNGASWSNPQTIDTNADVGMVSVSCASSTSCVATDDSGGYVVDANGTWSSPSVFDTATNPSDVVSCAPGGSPLRCVVGDDQGNTFSFDGTSWTEDTGADGTDAVTSVSCASASSCVAVDDHGKTLNFDGSNWSSPMGIDTFKLVGVSCPATSFCAAVDAGGRQLSFNGSNWTSPSAIGSDPTILPSVSCPTATFCAAVDGEGYALTYNGTSWSAPQSVFTGGEFQSVSCTSSASCVAVANTGNSYTYNGSAWTVHATGDSALLTSVSCLSATTCQAVDTSGDVITDNSGTWTSPVSIDTHGSLLAVSCLVSANFCAAGDNAGYTLTDTNGTWSTPVKSASSSITSMSCVSSSSCAAVDAGGNTYSYNGTNWSAAVNTDPGQSFSSVSCPSTSFCAAVDGSGNAFTESSGTWSSASLIDPSVSLESVSCLSSTDCVAVDSAGSALLYGQSPPGLYVSAVSPYAGTTDGGTSVTVTGSGFTGATAVHFGSTLGTGLTVKNDSSLTVTSPGGSAGAVDVTVTTPAGTSTTTPVDRFTYTVAQSPSTVSCNPRCTDSQSATLDTTMVSASSTTGAPGATLGLAVNADTLACPQGYNYAAAVSTLTATGFASTATVKVTETIAEPTSTKGVKVCFEPTGAAKAGFLPKCKTRSTKVKACLQSVAPGSGGTGIVVTMVLPANDPRFWAGGAPVDLKSFSPTKGPPGQNVTIKGKNLTDVTAVVMGGGRATIDTISSSKLIVTVPTSAQSGTLSVTAPSGTATSLVPFTVT